MLLHHLSGWSVAFDFTPELVALSYRFPQLLESLMQGNADRNLAQRGMGNTKRKEEIERLRRSEKSDDGTPIPVPPGVVEVTPKKRRLNDSAMDHHGQGYFAIADEVVLDPSFMRLPAPGPSAQRR